jgi:hypothetical protein
LTDLEVIEAWETNIRENQARNNAIAMAAAFNQMIQQVTGAPRAISLAQVKVPSPDEFKGEQAQGREFIRALRMYFIHPRIAPSFPDGESQVCYALTKLKEGGQRWATPIADAFLNGNPLPQICTDWGTFEDSFGMTFFNPHEEQDNETKWHDLKHVTSVAQYIIEFRDLMSRLGFNEAGMEPANRLTFLKGLKPRVQAEMHKMGVPVSLQGCMEMALRIDTAQYLSFKATQGTGFTSPRIQKPASGRSAMPGTKSASTSTGGAQQPMYTYGRSPPPGQAPAFKQEPVAGARPRITPEERDRRARERLCFYCTQPGHTARTCPHKVGAQVNEIQTPLPASVPQLPQLPQVQPDDTWLKFLNQQPTTEVLHHEDF